MEAPGQPLCGGPQHLKEILFKVKEILLPVSCKHVKLYTAQVSGGLQFVEAPEQVTTLPSPESGPAWTNLLSYKRLFFDMLVNV